MPHRRRGAVFSSTIPKTEAEFFALLDKIKADGTMTPLDMGTADQWESATMGFQNIGPNYSTDILGTFFYRTFFGFQLQLGNPTMGATVATMMFLIILTGVLLYLFLWQRKVQTYEV